MIEVQFSAAHALRGYKGKCENLHGHNYKIEVFARGDRLNDIGLLVDFKDLKAAAKRVIASLDHRNINEIPPFDIELNPSAENVAGYLLHAIEREMQDPAVEIFKVKVWETPTSVATYTRA